MTLLPSVKQGILQVWYVFKLVRLQEVPSTTGRTSLKTYHGGGSLDMINLVPMTTSKAVHETKERQNRKLLIIWHYRKEREKKRKRDTLT